MSEPTALETARKHLRELKDEGGLSVVVRKAITARRMSDAGYDDAQVIKAINEVVHNETNN